MLNTLVEARMGTWCIQVFKKETIAGHKPSRLPKARAIYVLNEKLSNYVGQSIDAFKRVRHHIIKKDRQNIDGKAVLIMNPESAMDDELLIHIEFGMMLIHLGCDRKLVSKQTDLPIGDPATRQLALDFFETLSANFHVMAPYLIGSRSRRNRHAIDQALPYLRMIWTDR